MERALSAGYGAPQGCPCGRRKDDLQHRLLECPKTAQAREEFTSGELRRLKDLIPDTSPPHLGFQCTPTFVGNPPPGTGLGAAKFWCRDPDLRPEDAFKGDVYIDGSCTCHGRYNFNAAGLAVVCMVDGEEFATCYGRVGSLGAQTSGAAEHLAAVAAGRLSPH
eukprot:4765400-Pyramimonas_sp.AAC.1